MIQAFTAYTYEIDDVEEALTELGDQLNLEGKLRKNSVGIITCFAEFIESGVVRAISEALPFDVLGTTTIVNASGDEAGETLLSLLILTSDDVSFATGLTTPIKTGGTAPESYEPLQKAYKEAEEELREKPSLLISFAPLIYGISGDYFMEGLEPVAHGIPQFGTIAVDHNENYEDSQVIYQGEGYKDCFAFILLGGDVTPKFQIGTISDEKIFMEKGIVTDAEGSILKTINDIPATKYMEEFGLRRNEEGSFFHINTCPLILDYNDGTKSIIRAMFSTTPEGYIVCGGNIPIGATISLGEFNAEEIRNTSASVLESVLEESSQSTMIMFSCVGRYFAQGVDSMQEIEYVKERLAGVGMPYIFAYSGGETCPVYMSDGDILNRIHNNTIVICSI